MESRQRKLVSPAMAILLTVVFSGPAAGQSVLSNDWEKFFEEKVSFGGFVENTTGFSISRGSRLFNTSNRFIMNRFILQPEFNFEFSESFKLFLSWRFVAEPRYSAKTKSREAAVQPAGTGRALPANFYSEYNGVPWEAVADILSTDGLHLGVAGNSSHGGERTDRGFETSSIPKT